jgi:hypothetical protein
MPERVSEAALQALFATIRAAAPSGVDVRRNEPLPVDLPAAGLVLVTDGTPGEPEETLSPHRYHYQHTARLEVIVEGATAAARDTAFDALLRTVGTALAADRTLGGVCEWCEPMAPEAVELAVEGTLPMKAATVDVMLHYTTADPLA